VDAPELLRVLTFRGADAEIRKPARQSNGEWLYPSPAREFRLSRIDVGPGAPWESAGERGVEILLCVDGRARVGSANMAEPLDLPRGASALVPACSPSYRLEGEARVFKAAVP
ncbi:MAG: mannose-6-phosphate isomerase, class I, partial [Candidatus Sumerlaeota bacterium]|nr:mannose-6-phosphate isomerase, class I [Candidatus Sumerlaeota bacterium]